MITKNFRLSLLAAAVAFTVAACAPDPEQTAMQKKYSSKEECEKDWSTPGDCTPRQVTGSSGHSALWFYGPLFYTWGAVMHSNGSMSYNQRVPSTGYYVAPRGLQSSIANRTNFAASPSGRAAAAGGVRGGFGSTAGSRGGYSSGG